MFGMFGGIGMTELIIVLIIILIIFGAKRLPEIGRGLGKGISDFKKASSGELGEDTVSPEPEKLSRDNTPEEPDNAQDANALGRG